MNRAIGFASLLLVNSLVSQLQGENAAPRPLRVVEARPDLEMNSKFASVDGWIGADGVYSVPLPDESILWVFGDTLVGRIRDGKRQDVSMVNNSFAKQRGWGADGKVELFLNRDPQGKASSFIAPRNKPGYFWLWDGFVEQGKLYLFATRLTSPGTITAFDWKLMDQSLVVVDNPLDDPAKWKTHQLDLPFGSFTDQYEAIWGMEVLNVSGVVHVYGTVRQMAGGPRSLVVAQFAPEHVTDFSRWKFFKEGEWQANAAHSSPLATHVGTEGSVTYLPDRGRWVYVYSPPLDPHIVMRTAESPIGPWSEPITVYTCPEAEWDKRIFCYAGKARLVPGAKDELLISYATNSFDMLPHVTADARVYVPRFVRATLGE